MKINIVCAGNRNFIIPMKVMLKSLAVNTRKNVEIFVLNKEKTYVQLSQDKVVSVDNANPIDSYFDKVMKQDMTYAEIRGKQRLYGKLWETEYENVIHWLSERCKYEDDKKSIEKFDYQVKKYIKEAQAVLQISKAETNSLNKSPSERVKSLGETAETLRDEGELYRDICLQIIEKSGNKYSFLKRDYDKVIIE